MRRQRRHGRPRHRAHQRGEWLRWGVQFGASARRIIRTTMDASTRIVNHPEYRNVIRGAFLAPWFAVSLGIVIAASLTLVAPRADLTFPATKSGQCVSPNCPVTRHESAKGGSRSSAGVVPKRSARLHTSNARRLPDRVTSGMRHEAAGVQVQYELLHEQSGHFMAMILVKGRKSLGEWSLRFVLPRARIGVIMWGKWSFEGAGKVLIDGIPSPWPRSSPDQARIVIFGVGTPLWPTGCIFNSARCAFTPLRRPSTRSAEQQQRSSAVVEPSQATATIGVGGLDPG